MKKISLSLLIIILLIIITFPVFANVTIIENLPVGEELSVVELAQKMEENLGTVSENNGVITNNKGIVSKNTSTGSISVNLGIITDNSGYVQSNRMGALIVTNNKEISANEGGTIQTNNGEINYNSGIIESNAGEVKINKYDTLNSAINGITNINNGVVFENYAKVTGGIIEKNYSKDVDNTTINNNYSNEVGNNVIIKKNFAEQINNTTTIIENQYYKLTIEGNANLVCVVDSNNNLNDNIYIDSEGQTWIRAEDSMYTITAKENYRIVGTPTIIAGGTTVVSKEDARNVSFSGINEEITIKVETENWINNPIKEENDKGTSESVSDSTSISAPETTPVPQAEPVQKVKTNNPQTGNSINLWIVALSVAIIGMIATRKNKKI